MRGTVTKIINVSMLKPIFSTIDSRILMEDIFYVYTSDHTIRYGDFLVMYTNIIGVASYHERFPSVEHSGKPWFALRRDFNSNFLSNNKYCRFI